MKKLTLLAIFALFSCSDDSEATKPTECNLGENRFTIEDGESIKWNVRTQNGLLNKGQAEFKGCFTTFGGLQMQPEYPNYYDPIFRLGDTTVNFLGNYFNVQFDGPDSLVVRRDETGNYTILRLSK